VKNLVFVALCGCILLGGARAGEMPQATPKDVGLSAAKLERVKNLVQSAVDENQTAGAIVLIARQGMVAYLQTFGRLNARADKSMPQDAIFLSCVCIGRDQRSSMARGCRQWSSACSSTGPRLRSRPGSGPRASPSYG
jgi:hypothetical protein